MEYEHEYDFLVEMSEHRKKFIPNSSTLYYFQNNQLIDYFIHEFQARDTEHRYTLKQDGNRVFFTDGATSMITLIAGTNYFQVDFDYWGKLAFSAVYEANNLDRSYYWKKECTLMEPGLYAALDIIMNPITADNFKW
ncbi:TPA: hypothetical protein P2R03_004085 [Aeromonas veronii]|nr:hypothetical protein [Aeromonas veronii]